MPSLDELSVTHHAPLLAASWRELGFAVDAARITGVFGAEDFIHPRNRVGMLEVSCSESGGNCLLLSLIQPEPLCSLSHHPCRPRRPRHAETVCRLITPGAEQAVDCRREGKSVGSLTYQGREKRLEACQRARATRPLVAVHAMRVDPREITWWGLRGRLSRLGP